MLFNNYGDKNLVILCAGDNPAHLFFENQNERNKSEAATYKYTCPYCGKKFTPYGNKKRKYCSHNCYIKDRFWREEDGV